MEKILTAEAILGIASAAVYIGSFLLYNRQVIKGSSKPNTATWTLWAFMSTLNCASYFLLREGWEARVLPTASAIANARTFFIALHRGKFSRIAKWDIGIMMIAALAILYWVVFQKAGPTSLIIQVAITVSFIPLYKSVWKRPTTETWFPWITWAIAYAMMLAAVTVGWEDNWIQVVYPANMLVNHIAIAILSLRKDNNSP